MLTAQFEQATISLVEIDYSKRTRLCSRGGPERAAEIEPNSLQLPCCFAIQNGAQPTKMPAMEAKLAFV